MYSNPPLYGARVVHAVLSDDALKAQWYGECKGMADRIIAMRTALRGHLEALGGGGGGRSWAHVTDQIGMFCYSGLDEAQVARMTGDHHIYMTKDGRISMAGVTEGNVEYIAKAIHDVTN